MLCGGCVEKRGCCFLLEEKIDCRKRFLEGFVVARGVV